MHREPIVIVLKNRRKAAGMTQQQLADEANMSVKTLQRIEQGADMKLSQYRQVIDALGVADLDISLDMLEVEGTDPADVAAAARLLSPETRRDLVAIILREYMTQHPEGEN